MGLNDESAEDMADLRNQITRADRNQDGMIDFLEFVLLYNDLVDFNFPEEPGTDHRLNTNLPTPILRVNSPPLLIGDYEVGLPVGHSLPPQPITSDLMIWQEDEFPPQGSMMCLSNRFVLVDQDQFPSLNQTMLRDSLKKLNEIQCKGLILSLDVNNPNTEFWVELSPPSIPVVWINKSSANTIRALSGAASSLSQSATFPPVPDSSQILKILGYSPSQIERAFSLTNQSFPQPAKSKKFINQDKFRLAAALTWLLEHEKPDKESAYQPTKLSQQYLTHPEFSSRRIQTTVTPSSQRGSSEQKFGSISSVPSPTEGQLPTSIPPTQPENLIPSQPTNVGASYLFNYLQQSSNSSVTQSSTAAAPSDLTFLLPGLPLMTNTHRIDENISIQTSGAGLVGASSQKKRFSFPAKLSKLNLDLTDPRQEIVKVERATAGKHAKSLLIITLANYWTNRKF